MVRLQPPSRTLRRLARQPIFALSTIALVALTVATVAAVATIADALLVSPVPVDRPDRVIQVAPNSLSHLDTVDLARQLETIEGLVPWIPLRLAIATGDTAETVRGAFVGRGFFETLELRPVAGRWFGAAAEGDGVTVVLGEALAVRLFGGADQALGQTVRISGEPAIVVAVAPAGFRGLSLSSPSQLWAPVDQEARLQPATAAFRLLERRDARWLGGVGRLAPGATLERARTEWRAVEGRLDQQFPGGSPRSAIPELLRDAVIPTSVRAAVRSTVAVLGVALILLILAVVANLALLVTARIETARGEMAVRLAQGGDRRRVMAPFLAEAVLLALAGTSLGLWFARIVLDALAAVGVSRAISVSLKGAVGLSAVALTVLVVGVLIALFALALGIRARRLDPAEALRGTRPVLLGRGRLIGINGLVALQIALAFLLIAGSTRLALDVRERLDIELGFQEDHLLFADVPLGLLPLSQDEQRRLRAELARRLTARPEVESAGWASAPPLGAARLLSAIGLAGDEPHLEVATNAVSGSYFETLGLPVATDGGLGRFMEPEPAGEPRVAVVSRALERELWGDGSALGSALVVESAFDPMLVEVVGVAADAPLQDLGSEREPQLYLPAVQATDTPVTLVLRTTLAPSLVIPVLREEVAAAGPRLPLDDIRTMRTQQRRVVASQLLLGRLVTFFALAVTLLAAVGLYGVFSWSVAASRPEIGVRLALGGREWEIYGWIVRRAVGLVVVGLAGGALLVGLVSHLVAPYWLPWLPPLRLAGPETAWTALGLLALGLLATAIPARRAARTDPAVVLRGE